MVTHLRILVARGRKKQISSWKEEQDWVFLKSVQEVLKYLVKNKLCNTNVRKKRYSFLEEGKHVFVYLQ